MFAKTNEESSFCFTETTFKEKNGRHQLVFAKIEDEMIKIINRIEIPFPGRPIKIGKFVHIINSDGQAHRVNVQ